MRKTLSRDILVEGVGIHTGEDCKIIVKPSMAGKGIFFSYNDNEDQKGYIPCFIANVVSTNRCTILGNGKVTISTVEHLLSALNAFEVTDAELFIERGSEVPILDGGGKYFSEQLADQELVEVDEQDVTTIVIDEDMVYTCPDSGAEYQLSPSDELNYEAVVKYDNEILGHVVATWTWGQDYASNIAPARTFSMYSEVLGLMKRGLIKGGDLSNAVVLVDNGASEEEVKNTIYKHIPDVSDVTIMQNVINGPMYFENEPARHKILDMIGDFSLLNATIKGTIRAVRPGHTGNINLVRHLIDLFYG
ncbi:UDP-3-O-acyl-N-acetylglucosamine deacetylase [Membranihabitans marinus]|uniref:UDP-3-O-acyl-N-acetylglucosamine deacetylase n=1 Tax=Membranihabitans marinus TaxID=1227546 RepID=UPI001F253256|nr:UDP-3-O-acyl-N-acetylglucosamine deacetylase [Membranihabitans marinus]